MNRTHRCTNRGEYKIQIHPCFGRLVDAWNCSFLKRKTGKDREKSAASCLIFKYDIFLHAKPSKYYFRCFACCCFSESNMQKRNNAPAMPTLKGVLFPVRFLISASFLSLFEESTTFSSTNTRHKPRWGAGVGGGWGWGLWTLKGLKNRRLWWNRICKLIPRKVGQRFMLSDR